MGIRGGWIPVDFNHHHHDHQNAMKPSALLALAHAWTKIIHRRDYDTLTQALSLLCYATAKERVADWVPQRTAGTDDQYLNPSKDFNSVWLQIQKIPLSRASAIFVTAATAGIRPCNLWTLHLREQLL